MTMININFKEQDEISAIVNAWIAEGNELLPQIFSLAKKEQLKVGGLYLAIIAASDKLFRENPRLWEEARTIVTATTKECRESELL